MVVALEAETTAKEKEDLVSVQTDGVMVEATDEVAEAVMIAMIEEIVDTVEIAVMIDVEAEEGEAQGDIAMLGK